MIVRLDLPGGDRQRAFLDFLNAAMRSRVSAYTGKAGSRTDGQFQSSLTGGFQLDAGPVTLTWNLVRDQVGNLVHLEITSADADLADAEWTGAVQEFVTSVLTATLADKKTSFFRRQAYCYVGPALDGEYWLPGFRFAPLNPADSEPMLMNAERCVTFDMNVNGIDQQHASALADERCRRAAAHMSLLLDVGLYRTPHYKAWVLPEVDGNIAAESKRYHLGFSDPNTTLSEMPAKGSICELGKYSGSLRARYRYAGTALSLPAEARRVLRGIDGAAPTTRIAFDRAARLYQVATVIAAHFPSAALAYRVAAVDAISQSDASQGSFADFMRSHVTAVPDLEYFIDYLYGNVRSAHFHGGEFPLGEFAPVRFFEAFMDAEDVSLRGLHVTCYQLVREAIVTWIFRQVPEALGAPDG